MGVQTVNVWWTYAGTIKFTEVPQLTWNITLAADPILCLSKGCVDI